MLVAITFSLDPHTCKSRGVKEEEHWNKGIYTEMAGPCQKYDLHYSSIICFCFFGANNGISFNITSSHV